jgi:ribose 5-phosphate isomerase A
MGPSFPPSPSQDNQKKAAAERALEFIPDSSVVGLGTGSTVKYLLEGLANRIRQGLRINGVPTSRGTATLAKQLGIPILDEEADWKIDVAIDGADQVDARFNLIKGGGGALLREKIVAKAARRFIVIVDVAKQVSVLGSSFPIPIEIVPFGWPNTLRLVAPFGSQVSLRQREGSAFVTDNGNYILDMDIPKISQPFDLETRLNQIPGVVENGIFTGMTSTLIVGTDQGTEVYECPASGS